MPSTFSNLLRYARSTATEATENFTTEAFAAAIRSDPGPFLKVLERQAVVASAADVTSVVPYTQVTYSGAGIIDLIVQVSTPEQSLEVWVEIKVAAGESGNQIDNYRAYIDARPAHARPILLTVARYPIRPDPNLVWVPWQAVWVAAATSTEPYWREFAEFLKEIHMADEFDAPVTSREAAALWDAARLVGKVKRILWPVFETARTRWSAVPWPAGEDELEKNLHVWFRNRGRYTTQFPGYVRRGAWIDMGVWPEEGESELGITVTTDPKLLEVRTSVIRRADAGGLPPGWERRVATWEALRIRRRLVSFDDHETARAWALARLSELADARVLELIGHDVPTTADATETEIIQ